MIGANPIENLTFAKLLSYGAIGLVAILAALAFQLLRNATFLASEACSAQINRSSVLA